ncbi:MAG: cation:proton antiporter [Terriglobales bacterium]
MEPLNTILLQLIVILATARLMGWLFQKMGQPSVIGEMTAGLMLGPSLLGFLSPALFELVFPLDSFITLNTLSRLGVWLFMFLVGVELDLSVLRKVGREAFIISQVSIITPLLFGSGLAILLYPQFAPEGVSAPAFALFMGAAMSITAFPVLARILKERGLTNSKLGVIAIACAAVDDVTAWCILAFTIVLIDPQMSGSLLWWNLTALVLYTSVMLIAVRPLLARRIGPRQRLSDELFAVLMIFLFVSCFTTRLIGVHALFGAFLFGVVLPKDRWLVEGLEKRLQPIVAYVLLPLFFAFTGLRTNITLIQGFDMWMIALGIVAIAVAGKFIGAMLPARLLGRGWRESAAIGALMNTRGLMELVILNIGLELGILSPSLFSMMVIMALVTTYMTVPVLNWVMPRESPEAEQAFSA